MAGGASETKDLMDYSTLAQEALRGVIRAALKRAGAAGGLPGDHHFYITLKTQAAGVTVPPDLAERFPDEITIVIQHQYWDLNPGETGFSVMLKFGGQPKTISAPYAAVTRFFDPSVQFLLQFELIDEGASAPAALPAPEKLPIRPRVVSDATAAPDDTGTDGPKIVSLDQFRKK